MAKCKKRISFWATETIKKPKRVSFMARGKKVSFLATKTIRRPKRVSFIVKKKKGKC